jgi:hypothetical protein
MRRAFVCPGRCCMTRFGARWGGPGSDQANHLNTLHKLAKMPDIWRLQSRFRGKKDIWEEGPRAVAGARTLSQRVLRPTQRVRPIGGGSFLASRPGSILMNGAALPFV